MDRWPHKTFPITCGLELLGDKWIIPLIQDLARG
jgi:hypothetical protein